MKTKLTLIRHFPIQTIEIHWLALSAAVITAGALFLCASARAQTGLIGKDSIIRRDPGGAKILWAAEPGHSYMLKSATNLAAPFTPTKDVSTNLITTTNYNSVVVPTTAQTRLFQLFQRDTDGPRIDNIWPADGAFAIEPQDAITARITDSTGVNLNSLAIMVGTNALVHWPDSRLVFTNDYLTYLPAMESWGPPDATVTATLRVADTLGHWSTNTWSFRLFSPPVLASTVVFVDTGNTTNGPGPHLTLISATGSNTFVYSYTGADPVTGGSGVTNGMCLVNTNVVGNYGRVVRGFSDSLSNNTVAVFTRPATLTDIFQSGSIRFHTVTAPAPFSPAPDAPPGPTCFPFGNQTIFSSSGNPNITIKTTPNTRVCVDGSLDGGIFFSCPCNKYFIVCTCPTVNVWVRPSLTVSGELAAQADVSANNWSSGDQNIHLSTIPVAEFYVEGIQFQVSVTLDLPWSASFDGTLSAVLGFDFNETACVTAGLGPDVPPIGNCSSSSITPIHDISGCGTANVRAGFSTGFQLGVLDNAASIAVGLLPTVRADATVGCSDHNRDVFSIDLCAGLDLSLTLGYNVLISSGSQTWSWDLIDCTPQPGFPLSGDLGPCPGPCGGAQPLPQGLLSSVYRPVKSWMDLVAIPGPLGLRGAADYRWGRMLGNDFLPFTDDDHIFNTRGDTLHVRNMLASDAGTYAVRVETPGGVAFVQSQLQVVPPPPTNSALVWIPAGAFLMGSPTNEAERASDEVEHSVTISQGFYIGKFEVTQNEYFAVTSNNPSHFLGPNLPVESVTWYDASNYCWLLTQQQQLNGQIPTNWAYRLPTEAEWEYACRTNTGGPSGTLTTPKAAFCYGPMLLGQMANFDAYNEYDSSVGTILVDNFLVGQTTDVGTYLPGTAGLYDMHGNVWEWCQDWYDSYPTDSVTDPQGPDTGLNRVIRGGGFDSVGAQCRAAYRFEYDPQFSTDDTGFRVVLAIRRR